MFYHIVIEIKPNIYGAKAISANVYDLSKEDLINKYAIPYFNNKDFIAKGYTLNKSNICRFLIAETNKKIDIIYNELREEYSRNNLFWVWNKSTIIQSEKFAKDITYEISKLSTSETGNIFNNNVGTKAKTISKSVFIVHGHDHNKVTEVENFIMSIGYDPIVLFKEVDGGNTIIEKIEENVEKAIYGIVIYSKCDVGYQVNCEDQKKYRARQNVVFEHGYLIAKLGRAKVCAVLTDDDIECPGDISGVIYKKFDSNGSWKYDIAKEMKAQGINIDLNMIR